MVEIVPIKLSMVQAYLIKGQRPLLVDSGMPEHYPALLRALRAEGVEPQDLSLLIHTHVHKDHAGCSARLRGEFGMPLAVGAGDRAYLESGQGSPLPERTLLVRLSESFMSTFPPAQADVVVEDQLDLAPYGVPGCAFATPGHTPGSLTVLVDGVGAIAGDLLAGGQMLGFLNASKPAFHPIIQDQALLRASIQRVLDYNPPVIYLGHGGPLRGDEARRWFVQAAA